MRLNNNNKKKKQLVSFFFFFSWQTRRVSYRKGCERRWWRRRCVHIYGMRRPITGQHSTGRWLVVCCCCGEYELSMSMFMCVVISRGRQNNGVFFLLVWLLYHTTISREGSNGSSSTPVRYSTKRWLLQNTKCKIIKKKKKRQAEKSLGIGRATTTRRARRWR